MSELYMLLNIGAISVPFLFSFHPKIQFYKIWKSFFPAMTATALLYLSWDVWFTAEGVWGFNDTYLTGSRFLGLPLEEWLFFICIPYACAFTHFTLVKLNPNFKTSKSLSIIIGWVLAIALLIAAAVFHNKLYTVFNFSLTGLILLYTLWRQPKALQSYFLTFVIILIPFFIINGVLTGTGIEGEVVWYNNNENLGIRMGTIPFEDAFYAMGFTLLNIVLTNTFNER